MMARLAYPFDRMGNQRSMTTSAIKSLVEEYG